VDRNSIVESISGEIDKYEIDLVIMGNTAETILNQLHAQ
jgi:hypothetical protein